MYMYMLMVLSTLVYHNYDILQLWESNVYNLHVRNVYV